MLMELTDYLGKRVMVNLNNVDVIMSHTGHLHFGGREQFVEHTQIATRGGFRIVTLTGYDAFIESIPAEYRMYRLPKTQESEVE
jgi:hypothetical protein